MTNLTVSVELTEVELKRLRTAWSCLFPWSEEVAKGMSEKYVYDMDTKLLKALSQFDTDREREAKVEFIRLYHLFESNPESPESALYRINEAGWDLVRMEDK
jgi:hypothetical protein